MFFQDKKISVPEFQIKPCRERHRVGQNLKLNLSKSQFRVMAFPKLRPRSVFRPSSCANSLESLRTPSIFIENPNLRLIIELRQSLATLRGAYAVQHTPNIKMRSNNRSSEPYNHFFKNELSFSWLYFYSNSKSLLKISLAPLRSL